MRNFACAADICHANRLSAAGIIGDGQHDNRNSVHADFFNGVSQRIQIHIALEWIESARVSAFRYDEVTRLGSSIFNMCAGRIEMGVVEHNITGTSNIGKQNVFSRPSLMGGNQMFKSCDVAYGIPQSIEGRGAGI